MSKNASTDAGAKPEPTEEVTLGADHEHGGVAHKKGDKLTVPTRVADWLRANGVVNQPSATNQS